MSEEGREKGVAESRAGERFRWVIENHHQYAREWKESTGGKVIGYLCTYVPEELFYALGILPVRILGSHEPQDVTEPHIFNMFCPYSRDCLAQGLLGRYAYLDGITTAHGCYQIRQTFHSWQRHIPSAFQYHMFMPTDVQSRSARSCLPRELSYLKASLEEWTGMPLTQEALEAAMEVYDTNRRLLREIYELRKADTPPLSGSEALEMVLAGVLMDKKEHNSLLEQLLRELSQRQGKQREARVRVMLVSSEMDDVELLRLIEALGGEVVIDDNCVGTRYFWNQAVANENPLEAIANRYLDKPPCPVYDVAPERRRLPHILGLAKDYRVQSAILVQLKFCDPHQYDMPSVEALFRENNILTLLLESDITIPVGQFRTRLEAHLEMLQLEG